MQSETSLTQKVTKPAVHLTSAAIFPQPAKGRQVGFHFSIQALFDTFTVPTLPMRSE
jgi:hypothetical protein